MLTAARLREAILLMLVALVAATALLVCRPDATRIDAAQLCVGVESSSDVCVPLP